MALSFESRSADYFRSFAEAFSDTGGKEILRQFADREMQHCEMLNRGSRLGPA
jgi:rubrerythrin